MAYILVNIGEHTNAAVMEFRGLSTDTKPIGSYKGDKIPNGSIFLEMDTRDVFFYNVDTQEWLGD